MNSVADLGSLVAQRVARKTFVDRNTSPKDSEIRLAYLYAYGSNREFFIAPQLNSK